MFCEDCDEEMDSLGYGDWRCPECGGEHRTESVDDVIERLGCRIDRMKNEEK